MCMKYEKDYGMCWDYLFINMNMDESIIELLEKHYNVNIIDKEKFRSLFFDMIEKLHEIGSIKPIKNESKFFN